MNDFRIPFSPQPAARSPELISSNRTHGPRTADRIVRYWVFVPLVPPVIGVTTTFRNHTTS